MTSLTQDSLKLEYFLEDEYRWCPLKIIGSRFGSKEIIANVTKLDELPDVFNGCYLYSQETCVWFYDKIKKDDVRIVHGSILDDGISNY
uniref:Uncharacterized protein n=1 Tax=viral metagenome TaxID=1070528 RepID=A0A6C0LII1_9ZZZZ